jgi:hypothetical protein
MKRRAAALAVGLALAGASSAPAALDGTSAVSRASALPAVRAALRAHPHAASSLSGSAAAGWQVGYYAHSSEFMLVIFRPDGSLLGVYTGFKVAWQMARGYPGAFGGVLDALYVWVPLSLLFVAPFLRWRRPLSLVNLDLLALSGLSVSFGLFNRADIAASVPAFYPPLVYLLVRMLWLGVARGPRVALRPNIPAGWLAGAIPLLLAGQIAIAIWGSSVIDVGYANVYGASRIVAAEPLYGTFHSQVSDGDTYGPVSYEAYIPFTEAFGTGTFDTDQVPAAVVAAICFELACVALLFALGRRLGGWRRGVVFAYAWCAYPFTALALACATNDALVAALVLGALLAARSPARRGALAALAGFAKFAPLALAPLFLTYRLRETRVRGLVAFSATFALVAVAVSEPAYAHDTLGTIYRRTIAYQAGRVTPFSVWGLYGHLAAWQTLVQIAAILLCVALALAPRREDLSGLAACCAAILIALQLGASYWFYLYIPWFFAPAIPALLGGDQQLLDRVGPQRRRAAHEDAHQPRVLLGRLQPRRHLRHQRADGE